MSGRTAGLIGYLCIGATGLLELDPSAWFLLAWFAVGCWAFER